MGGLPRALSPQGNQPAVAVINVAYRTGIGSNCEEVARLALVRRESAAGW